MDTTRHPYISSDKEIADGEPIIISTRTRVIQIAMEYTQLGYSPDDIVEAHPHLKLAQVHDALSFYHENKAIFDRKIEESLKFYEEGKKSSKLRYLTDQKVSAAG